MRYQCRPAGKPAFRPRPQQDMLVACLWSRWTGPGEPELLSFAAITDEPPAEVAAAGHDRCIIPVKPQNLEAWLTPRPDDLATQYAILDDRERPYYEHRLAAESPRHPGMAYNKNQWVSSFEDQMTILRPHLTERVLSTMTECSPQAYGAPARVDASAATVPAGACSRASASARRNSSRSFHGLLNSP
jgi:hypothetical protein